MNTATTATVGSTVAETTPAAPVDLGGEVTVTAIVNDTSKSAVASTPGAAAKRRANAKAPKAVKPAKVPKAKVEGEKRAYTARGTTVQARRVVLTNGVAKGRGRPADEVKGKRRVVYVPVGMKYDAAIHGTGVVFNTATHKAPSRRLVVAKLGYQLPAKLAKKVAAAAGSAKAKKSKAKAKVTKSKTLPVATVSAPVIAEVPATAPASTETVTA